MKKTLSAGVFIRLWALLYLMGNPNFSGSRYNAAGISWVKTQCGNRGPATSGNVSSGVAVTQPIHRQRVGGGRTGHAAFSKGSTCKSPHRLCYHPDDLRLVSRALLAAKGKQLVLVGWWVPCQKLRRSREWSSTICPQESASKATLTQVDAHKPSSRRAQQSPQHPAWVRTPSYPFYSGPTATQPSRWGCGHILRDS